MTAPTSGTYVDGQSVTIYWLASNFATGSTISLCYDQDTAINGNEHYIEVDKVTAANSGGYSSYTWTIGASRRASIMWADIYGRTASPRSRT